MAGFDAFWAKLKAKRPALEKDEAEVTINAKNLRLLLKQAYDEAISDTRNLADGLRSAGGRRSPFGDIFSGM